MKLVILQRKIKLKLLAKTNINKDLLKIKNFIDKFTLILNENYKNDIININVYNINLVKLEEINNDLETIDYPFFYFNKIKITKIRKKLDIYFGKIKNLVSVIGSSLKDIIFFTTGLIIDNNYINFIDKIFYSINYKVYKKEIQLNISSDDTKDNYDKSNINYNINELTNKKTVFKEYYKFKRIKEYTFGARLYYYLEKHKLIIVCDGYFQEDPLDIYKRSNFLKEKLLKLKTKLDFLTIDKKFKKDYLDQINIKELLVFSNDNLSNKCLQDYKKLNSFKNEPLSSLVKTFLLSDTIEQRRIIMILFLESKDTNIMYLSYLLFDLINNDSYLLKSNPLSDEIYKSLHWKLKKKLKINTNKFNKLNDDILEFDETELSYEKRINLMNTDKSIKNKAMIKYKDFVNKGTESGKAQHYLDGILKIPFKIYRKESIFTELSDIKNMISMIIKNDSSLSKYKIETRSDIELFFNNLITFYKKKINLRINNKFKSLDFSDFKLKEIKDIVTKTNSFLESNIKISNSKKEKLFSTLIKVVIDIDDVKKKNIILKYFKKEIDIFNNNEINCVYKKWLRYYKNIKNYINNKKEILDTAIYKQNSAKNEIIHLIGQWINGEVDGSCLGFEGPPGVGKTTFAKEGIAKCLIDESTKKTRPFAFIQIGGTSNGSMLEGHNYTYLGSKWGKIIDILIETQCMNPIIYIDELDKISATENGKELIGILTHITDPSQNNEFEDKYFHGIKIDLSRVLFIFSYNDSSLIDPILLDRIHQLKFRALNRINKVYIVENYIIPEIIKKVGISKNNLQIGEKEILYIIDNYTYEAGVRKIKEKMYEIIRYINIQNLTNNLSYPLEININFIETIFRNKPKMNHQYIYKNSLVGIVNGLYATSHGVGGIIPIESFKMHSESCFKLEITGKQGEVMKESILCAKTLVWNILPNNIKKKIKNEWEKQKWGIHIHCPDTSTPKDGPSAGAAITLSIISLLTNIPVLNTVAITGEIDLKGNVRCIGGLENKIEGSKNAGVKLVLYPYENNTDIEIIRNNEPSILENIEIKPVKTIWDILDTCLVKNNLNFTKF